MLDFRLGNELCGSGISARIEAEQYARDIAVLKKIVDKFHPNAATRPKVLGPAGFYDKQWFDAFLDASGPNVVDGVTHHIYNLGAGWDFKEINNFLVLYFCHKFSIMVVRRC